VCPVFALHRIYSTEEDRAEVVHGCTTAAIGCVDCKKKLLVRMDAKLDPIREKRRELEASRHRVYDIVMDGIERARAEVRETMDLVREAVNLNYGLGK
jgi:tryptophanyl-tRNA synthetase